MSLFVARRVLFGAAIEVNATSWFVGSDAGARSLLTLGKSVLLPLLTFFEATPVVVAVQTQLGNRARSIVFTQGDEH